VVYRRGPVVVVVAMARPVAPGTEDRMSKDIA